MRNQPITGRWWTPWVSGFVLWTLVGLSFASQFYIASSKVGFGISWGRALSYSLGDWYLFGLISIPIIRLARRFQFERRHWGQTALIHLLGSAAFSLIWMLLRAGVAQGQGLLAGEKITFFDAFHPLVIKTFNFNVWIYWIIVAVVHAFDYYRKFHERELKTFELETRLAQAKLQSLQMQLNPHFLFNTLHTISALMHKDVEAADRMLARLSDLLRMAVDNTDTHEVPLSQELDFLRRYLEIEQTRFGARLSVTMKIAPETLAARVPNLVLQPLVENAIRHGIEPHAKPGTVELSAVKRGDTLELRVQDNGSGVSGSKPVEEGVGLANTRERLSQLYGMKHSFELGNAAEGGFLAKVGIPFHTQDNPDLQHIV